MTHERKLGSPCTTLQQTAGPVPVRHFPPAHRAPLCAPFDQAPSGWRWTTERRPASRCDLSTSRLGRPLGLGVVRNAQRRESGPPSWTVVTAARVQPSERGGRTGLAEMQVFIVRTHRSRFCRRDVAHRSIVIERAPGRSARSRVRTVHTPKGFWAASSPTFHLG